MPTAEEVARGLVSRRPARIVEGPLHLAGLNGLRAIAALAVVVSHTTMCLAAFGLDPYILGVGYGGAPKGLDLAGFGVSIFFALSGFLITFLLLLESQKAGIDVKKFYIRRILRIWPLYYAYLAVCMAVIIIFRLEWRSSALGFYVLYAANISFIMGMGLPLLEHFWSLGVEEQYYLAWPWLVKASGERLLALSIALAALLMATKCAVHLLRPGSTLELALYVTRFQCMLIGGVGAILYHRRTPGFVSLATHVLVQAAAWIVVLLLAVNRFHIASVIDNEIISLVAVALIMGQIAAPKRFVDLDRDSLEYLGKISYGIYVLHPLIIFLLERPLRRLALCSALKYPAVYAIVLGATITAAHLSYEFLEERFLMLKERFACVRTSSTRVTSA